MSVWRRVTPVVVVCCLVALATSLVLAAPSPAGVAPASHTHAPTTVPLPSALTGAAVIAGWKRAVKPLDSIDSACSVSADLVTLTCSYYSPTDSNGYSNGASDSLSMSTGAYDVTYVAGGGGGAGGGGQGSHSGGTGAYGALLDGSLDGVSGTTLKIGLGSAGHNAGGNGSDPLTDYGQFNGGGGGNGTDSGGSGGHGGAATIIGSDGDLLVVAGAGGGGGGADCCDGLGGVPGDDRSGSGTTGDNGDQETGSGGGNGGSSSGSGGGGGGGGYFSGKGGGGGGVFGRGDGGHGGQSDTFDTDGKSATIDSGSSAGGNTNNDGYVQIVFDRTQPTLSPTAQSATVYADQSSAVSVDWSLASSAGSPTGTIDVDDETTGQSICDDVDASTTSCAVPAGDLTAGTHTIDISYFGDNGYQPVDQTTSLVVTPDPVTLGLSRSAFLKNGVADGDYSLTATVTPSAPDAGDGYAFGSLALTATDSSGSTVDLGSSCSTSGDVGTQGRGQALAATCTPQLPPGTYSVSATFTPTSSVTADAGSGQPLSDPIADYEPGISLSFDQSEKSYGSSYQATVTLTQSDQSARQVWANGLSAGRITVEPQGGTSPSCIAERVLAKPGTFTCTLSGTPVGSADYVATIAAAGYWTANTSSAVSLTTDAVPPTLGMTTSLQPANDGTYSTDVGTAFYLLPSFTINGRKIHEGTWALTDTVTPTDGSAPTTRTVATAQSVALLSSISDEPPIGTNQYFLSYDDSGGNYGAVASTKVLTVTVNQLPTTLTVSGSGDATKAVAQGIPVTVDAVITLPAADTTQDPEPSLSTPSGVSLNRCTTSVTDQNGPRLVTRECSYLAQPGTTPSFTATYSDPFTEPGAQSTAVTVPASPISSVGLTVPTTSRPYGSAPTYVATVRPVVTGVALDGAVAFTDDGSGVAGCSAVPVAADGTATCAPTAQPDAGTQSVVATYTAPANDAFTSGTGVSAAQVYTVTALPVSISFQGDPSDDGTNLDVTVQAKVDGTGAVASGKIAFSDTLASCGTVVLTNGVADCSVDDPGLGTPATLTATFVPSTDYIDGATPKVTEPYERSSGTCSPGYQSIWNAVKNHQGTITAGDFGSLTLSPTSTLHDCDKGVTLQASAIVDLFDHDLTGTVNASVQDTQLCLTSGSLSLPSVAPSKSLDISAKVCLPITDAGKLGAPTSGQLSLDSSSTGTSLPLVTIPGIDGSLSLTADLGSSCEGDTDTVSQPGTCATQEPAVTATAALTASGTTTVTLNATVFGDGSIHGFATTGAIGLFGGSIVLAGGVDRAASAGDGTPATVTASIGATLATDLRPVASVPMVVGAGSTITLSGGTGTSPTLQVAGTVTIGTGSSALGLTLSGTMTSFDDYDLQLGGTATWAPTTGLSFAPVLAGDLMRSVDSTGKATTTFSASATSAPGTHLFAWAAPGGVTIDIDTVAFGGDPTTVDAGCPSTSAAVASISGSMQAGGLDVAAAACVSTVDGSWHAAADVSSANLGPLHLTALSFSATHPAGGTTTVTAGATATATVGGTSLSTPVTMTVSSSGLVAGGGLTVGTGGNNGLGLPASSAAYLLYSSYALPSWSTGIASLGDGGTVDDVAKGVTLFGALPVPAPVAGALRSAGFGLADGAVLTARATIDPTAKQLTFTVSLDAPNNFPVLTLPGKAALDSATLTYAAKSFELVADGTVQGQDGSADPVHLDVSVGADGSAQGSASVTGLSLFGTTLTLSGSVTRSTGGTWTASITATIGSLHIGDATLTGTTVTLGTEGLSAAGTIVAGSADLAFTASFTSTSVYTLTVLTTITNWTPATGVTVNAEVTGSLTHTTKDGFSFDFSATPVGGASNLLDLQPATGVDIGLNDFELSDRTAPSTCSVVGAGDVWLEVSGSLSFSQSGSDATDVAATGCFDLTKPAFAMRVTLGGNGLSLLGGKVTIGGLTVDVTHSGSGFAADAAAQLTITMPHGGTFSVYAVMTFGENGFAIGAEADLSSYLGGSAASAYLYYASAQISVDTGDPTLGTIVLKPGVTVGLDFAVSDGVATALQHFGFGIGSGSKLAATANINLSSATITLTVALAFQQTYIFQEADGTSLRADSMALDMTLSPTQPSFGFSTSDTLHIPATTPGGQASDVTLTGGISIGTQLTAYLTVQNWNDALGLQGLDLDSFTLQGGITLTGLPLPSLAVSAQVSGLPQSLADVLGYQQGAPISIALAVGETNLLFDLKIGTQDSGTPALEPFSFFGKASLLEVDYAELYISPTGATIGQDVYPPGFAIAFQGKIFGVDVSVLAKIDPVAASFSFDGTIGTITAGSLVIGPTTLHIDASPTTFNISFTGNLDIGPSTTQIGPALRFSGYLRSDVTLSVGTDGLAAHMDFDASVTGSNYLPQGWCKQNGIWVLCDYQWIDDSPLTIHADNLGFSLNSSGLTVDIPNTTSHITFPWPSSPSSAGERPLNAAAAAAPRVQNLDLSAFHPAGATTAHAPPVRTAAASTWHATGSLGTARVAAASLVLRNGSVLVVGGGTGSQSLGSAEIYNPATGGWTGTGSMRVARTDPTLVQLADGRVLAIGGDTGSTETASAEIYDPATGRWIGAGTMSQARQAMSAALLPDGRVLVAGGHVEGRPVSTVDIFDPRSRSWSAGPSLGTARAAAAAATLADGSVLVAGGLGTHGPLSSTEVFVPASGTWHAAAPMQHARFYASATRLRDGRILVAGDAAQAEAYTPATGRWSYVGSQQAPAQLSSTATLADGHVLIAGGMSYAGDLAQVDEFDPTTNHWTARTALPDHRAGAVAAAVPGGVLVAGGLDAVGVQRSAYVYALRGHDVPVHSFRPAVAGRRIAVNRSGDGWSTTDTLRLVAGLFGALVLLLAAGFVIGNRRRHRPPAGP